MKLQENYIELQKQLIESAKKISEIDPVGNSYVEIKQSVRNFANIYMDYVVEVKRLKNKVK